VAAASPPEWGGAASRRRHSAALDGAAGFVEAPHFYNYLTGRKNLELLAAFDGGDAKVRIGLALEAPVLRVYS